MPSAVTVEWKGDIWRAAVVPHLNTAVTFAATVAKNAAYRNITAGQSPPASRPGDFPHRDTGELSESLTVVSPLGFGENLHAAMGTSVPWGKTLEFGGFITRNAKGVGRSLDWGHSPSSFDSANVYVAPRPWIVRSLFGAAQEMRDGFIVVARTEIKAVGLSM